MADHNRQRLLVDTDAFCKLGVAGLLTDAIGVLGVTVENCGRLAALPYMLRRGRLRSRFGDCGSDTLERLAETMALAEQPGEAWLDPLTAKPSIDPGEAQLLAASAEHGLLLLTGDKRGLRSVKDIPGYAEALDGRIVILEAILAELCMKLGVRTVRSRIRPLMDVDTTVRICFSDSNATPVVALLSYYNDLSADVEPLELWKPPSLGAL